MTDLGPQVDSRHPADVVTDMVDHVLRLAETWPRWDGRPSEVPVEGEPPRIYTPHKAIRRVADHLVDHLAEFEARLAGRPTEPDRWHASAITTAADLAAFTTEDLDEARSRLRRLALTWVLRLPFRVMHPRAHSSDRLPGRRHTSLNRYPNLARSWLTAPTRHVESCPSSSGIVPTERIDSGSPGTQQACAQPHRQLAPLPPRSPPTRSSSPPFSKENGVLDISDNAQPDQQAIRNRLCASI